MERKRGEGRSNRPRVEWPTVALILSCYGGWLAVGLFLWPTYPLLALLLLALLLALQSSLMHEASHGHPTRNAAFNEFLVGLPIGLVYPFRRFKTLHLRHHADERLTDPFDDPESWYLALWKHEQLPGWMKGLLRANNTMVGRFVLGPFLSSIAFLWSEWRLLRTEVTVRRAWALHLAGLALVLPVVEFGFGMPLWLYLLVPVWLGQSLIAVRTFAEHQWSERPDGRTVIVESSPLALLFLNNNLHLVHHKDPTAAWYDLPRLYRERRAEWLAINDGYAYPNYLTMLRAHAFRAKEPVVHPVLRRQPEPGRAFRPRVRGRSLGDLGSAPAPANPPRE